MSMRLNYFIGFVVICLLLLTSVYLEFFAGIIPCPLCTLQRLSFGLLGVVFFSGIFFSSQLWSRLLINFISAITSACGIFLAGRQIWLQHLPNAGGDECSVSIHYMMQVLPFHQVLQKILEGSAECEQRGWEFLHFNMAEWALLWFVLFLLFSLYLFLKEIKNHNKTQ